MNRVLKTELELGYGQIRAGSIARPLAIAFQNEVPVCWFEGEPGDTPVADICLLMTGVEVPDNMTYVGTATLDLVMEQKFVVHLYWRPLKPVGFKA